MIETGTQDHPGIIYAVRGTTPGPASGISYDVIISVRGSDVQMNGMKPGGARFPDTLNTIAAPPSTEVVVREKGGYFYLLPPGEAFEVEVCEEPEP